MALTSTANVGTATPADGYGTPSPVTAAAFLGQGVQKYGRTTGLQLGTVAELSMTVDVCYVFILRPSVSRTRGSSSRSRSLPVAFSARWRLGFAHRHPGRQPARRVAVRRRGGLDDRQSDRRRAAAVRRHDRRFDSSRRPAGRPHRSLAASPGDASASSPGTRPPSPAARRSRATRSIAARARTRRPSVATLGVQTSIPGHGTRERHHLLLQGVRAERERRGPALGPGAGHAHRLVPPSRAASHARQLRRRLRKPALRSRTLGERGHGAARWACTSPRSGLPAR